MYNAAAIQSLKEEIDSLNQQAWDLRVSDSLQAFELSKQAVEKAQPINYTKGFAEGLRTFGFCHMRLSKYEEAMPLLKQALPLFESLNDLTGQSEIYEYFGVIHRIWGNLGDSLEFLFKALSFTEQSGCLEDTATNNYQLGVTYKQLGDYEKALDHLYQSFSVTGYNNTPLYQAYSINVIGSIYFDNGDYEHALEYFQQGLVARHESGDKWGEAGSLDNIGFTYLKLKNYEQAIYYCDQSLAISQGTADKRSEANALLHLAEIYKQTNDREKATKFCNESLEIRKASGDKRGEAEILLFLAELHKDQPESDEKNFNWLNNVLKIAEEIKAVDLLSKTRFHLYEYYKQKGNFEEALKNLDLHTNFEKEFHKNTIKQKISNLEISHKAEVVSQRNKELTELNEKIEKANEELKIEASLERVRTAAMAMKEPADMLEVCRIISEQMELMNVKDIRNVQTAIINEEKGIYLNYEYFAQYKRTDVLEIEIKLHPAVEEFANEMLKSKDAIFFKSFEGEALNDWREYRRKTNQDPDPLLDKASSLHYYFYSIGPGALGISVYSKLKAKEIELFKRFHNVFELAYRRFIDIEKAEAQAKESQIQLALERVRARTMAMQRSDELPQAANVLFQQIQLLGIHPFSTGYNIWEENKKTVTSWMSSEDIIQPSFKLPLTEETSLIECYEAALRGDTLFVQELGGAKLGSHLNYMRTLPVVGELMKKIAEAGFPLPDYMINHHAFFSNGYLLFITYAPVPEAHEIFKRFAKVFEQTYTRFLDLQKAEAQTKEAQTEVALERIRARAMAMHSSNELMDVAHILREQMGLLDQPDLETSVVNLMDEDSDNIQSWHAFREPGLSSGRIIQGTASFGKDSSELTREMLALYHSGKKEYTLEAAGEKLNEFIQVLIDAQPEVLNYIAKDPPDRVYYHFATFTGGALLTVSYQLPTEDIKSLQRRAASVFDMAYRRYLDLKKAEAQTREAQIEIAVERVRSKALAMHRSEEILEVVVTLRNELMGLNIPGVAGTTIYLQQENGNIRMWDLSSVVELEDGFRVTLDISYKLEETHPEFYVRKIWNATEKYFVIRQDEHDLALTLDWLRQYKPEDADNIQQFVDTNNIKQLLHPTVQLEHGRLSVDLLENVPAEMESIMIKMGAAFDLAYKRFLDLQKAEAQAREAQIEVALERVRAKVMAMTNSNELNATSLVFGEQLRKLNVDWQFSYFWLIDESKSETTFWITWPDYKTSLTAYTIAEAAEYFNDCLVAWRGGVKIHDNYVPPEGVQEWLDTFQRIADDAGGVAKEIMVASTFPTGVYYYDAMMKYGSFGICISKPATDEEKNIQCRFAIEFERAYTRFLDLKQAEAQTREAKIEAALERVRAKAMAMHKTEDLNPAVATVFEELDKLNIGTLRCGIAIMDKEKPRGDVWITVKSEQSNTIQVSGDEALDYHPLLRGAYDGWLKQEDFSYVLQGEDLLNYYRDVASIKYQLPVSNPFDKEKKDQQQYYFNAVFQDGSLFAFLDTAFTDEAKTVMKRFANVFNLTYKRFLDLQKAEAQTREAKIEAALERVRAKAMAMHKSEDLNPAVATVFEELDKLNLGLIRCGIAILDKEKPRSDIWITIKSDEGSAIQVSGDEPLDIHPLLKGTYDAWRKQEDFSYVLQDDDLLSYYQAITKTNFQLPISASLNTENKDQHQYYYNAVFQDGSLFAFLDTAFTDEAKTVMKRFANVFNLTYKRFLDLQKAEAQAREARIETALEKVRASTMAMQRSEDLSQTAFVLFNQFKELGEAPERIFIATFDDHDSGVVDLWGTDQGGNQLNKLFKLPVNEPTMVSKIIAAWKEKKRSVVVDLKGEELKTYLGFLKQAGIPVTEGVMTDRRVQTAACFSNGVIGVTTPIPQSAESVQLQERFAGVFDLTYTRFLDLQKAEAQTHEARIETALERVRARALAMQQPEELKEVAQVLRTEMGLLGVEELETCSIYINDENAEKAECWYALKDIRSEEKKLVNDHFALNLNDTWVSREMLRFYQSPEKQISIVMQGENRKEWIRYCEEHSAPFRGYYGEVIPDRTYHMYKFSHGAIGAAAAGDISAESWRLLRRAASVFSLAYSRFKDLTQARNDLIKLKEEKKRAEDALSELQATQKQLIQSEKMASLGELTAGIAHEIQNPLNFVNNFSDVSNELLEEMKTELATGNTQSAIEIAKDVKDNLEKILHHGKRADAIVKGMLQHSRSSSGQKELTDINTLADEYLRLAYHGLRAKDKFFNAKFETDLDPSVNKINVVPQEIGRVILNLINNAFYAVTEKRKLLQDGYEPIVTISTKTVKPPLGGLGVEIKVSDNGNGIPQKVLDKIFQPFFTTKPTGQGTGLGLSLSYDIITKGHDGEIKVETKEGEGSEFTIILPMN